MLKSMSFLLLFISMVFLLAMAKSNDGGWAPFVFPTILLIYLSFKLFTYSKKKIRQIFNLSPPIQNKNLELILFLRPFLIDKKLSRTRVWAYLGGPFAMILMPGYLRTCSENLSKLFRKQGNLIAVGSPGEKLPQLGPFSVYYSNNDWELNVGAMMMRCKYIIVYAGTSKGCLWELEYIVLNKLFFKSYIYLPTDKDEYSYFRDFFKSKTNIQIPENTGDNAILLFDPDNFAYFLKVGFFNFSSLPDFVFTIKKAFQFRKKSFVIRDVRQQMKLGKLDI